MSEQVDTAKSVVAAARKHGANAARASVSRRRECRVEWRDGKLDRLRESTRMSVSVSLYVDGRYSSNTTSDLRPEALDRFIAESVAMTRVLTADPHRKLPPPERCKGRFSGDLGLLDPGGLAADDASTRRASARGLEEAMRSAPGADAIVSATGTVVQGHNIWALADSQGMAGETESSSFTYVAMASVKGKGDRKPTGYWWASSRKKAELPSIEEVGREATRRALTGIGETPMPSGKYPCIVENVNVSRLLRGVLSPLSGNALQQKRSFLVDQRGKKVGSKTFTVVDDPLLVGGLGSGPFDSEGMSTIRRPIFEDGVLKTFFLDTYYASKMGEEPTTGGWNNLVFAEGKRDLDALIKTMGRGILITGFSGGNANSATGDFSVGIRGQWVEGGKIVKPVAEMNLAGNHLTFWQGLEEVGSDAFRYDSVRAPSMRFREVQFSGV